MPKQDEERVPAKMQPTYDAIISITDEVCREHLTDEYAALARKMAAALARKRPSPLATGRERTWACSILYALGRVNFLHDKSQTPHMRMDELCKRCGVSQGSASAKARIIHDKLELMQLHPDWTLPSRLADNPLAWMLMVNGIPVDARWMPREFQEEVYRMGLIPYIPDDGPPQD
jgi:hypothetical protein